MNRPNQSALWRVKWIDRAARWVVTLGGVVVIVGVLGILLVIVGTAIPLFLPIRAHLLAEAPLPEGMAAADVVGLSLETGLTDGSLQALLFDTSGKFAVYDLVHRKIEKTVACPLPEAKAATATKKALRLISATPTGPAQYALTWSDGSLTLAGVSAPQSLERGVVQATSFTIKNLATIAADSGRVPQSALIYRGEEEKTTAVALYGDHRIIVSRLSADLSGDMSSTQTVIDKELPEPVTCVAMDHAGRTLYAGTQMGSILWWRWDGDDDKAHVVRAFRDKRAITSMTLALGDVTLVVGDAKGDVTNWFLVRSKARENQQTANPVAGAPVLQQIRELEPHSAAIAEVVASSTNRAMLIRDSAGGASIDFTTSERRLATLPADQKLKSVNFATQGDRFIGLTDDGKLKAWSLRGSLFGLASVGYHPEVSWKSLCGTVWYENHDHPEYEWQATGGADYEAKLSLVPLIFGTLKGTFYAMLLGCPIALAAAAYVSHFASPAVKAWIKPLVEMMAAVPSVVLGFLVALWLAPKIQIGLLALGLSFVTVPATFLVFLLCWQFAMRSPRLERLARSREFVAMAIVMLVGVGLAMALAGPIERGFFAGDVRLWMFKRWGLVYDPKNSVLISFGVGFMVIPIIFSLAEDALSSVPHNMAAASMALGASRWQTLWRVILPSASPGIFAAIMIGFGRAVGETMVFLAAAGATAIIDFSPFNAMRTLSANIAQEIPEAAVGSTHRRVLFLCAVILFLMTSFLNTAAEVVRQRLRKRFGQF